MSICFNTSVELLSENDRIDAGNTFHNFKQGCDIFTKYQMTYEQYIDNIIIQLIQQTLRH